MGQVPGDPKNELLELDDPAAPEAAGAEAVDEGASSGAGNVQYPTVIPKFDPAQYAEESEIRERMPTFTDEAALENARLQSFPTNIPPPCRPMSTVPGPLVPTSRDSSAEIDTGESDLDALDPDEQVAILNDRLCPLTRVPTLAREMTQLGALLEDPKTAYVLGFVDGILPLETIVDVTGLPELDTLRALERMIAQGVVVFRASKPR